LVAWPNIWCVNDHTINILVSHNRHVERWTQLEWILNGFSFFMGSPVDEGSSHALFKVLLRKHQKSCFIIHFQFIRNTFYFKSITDLFNWNKVSLQQLIKFKKHIEVEQSDKIGCVRWTFLQRMSFDFENKVGTNSLCWLQILVQRCSVGCVGTILWSLKCQKKFHDGEISSFPMKYTLIIYPVMVYCFHIKSELLLQWGLKNEAFFQVEKHVYISWNEEKLLKFQFKTVITIGL